jgi:hypothetical protein
MAEYRIYWIEADGHIRTAAEIFERDTDEEALAFARDRRSEKLSPIEVWCGTRLVAAFDAGEQDRAHNR